MNIFPVSNFVTPDPIDALPTTQNVKAYKKIQTVLFLLNCWLDIPEVKWVLEIKLFFRIFNRFSSPGGISGVI
jgi:hypothetical protein